jgi:signal transduction histidine kinase
MPMDERILIVAPIGADAANLSSVLKAANMTPAACHNLAGLVAELGRGCGTAVLTEEALNDSGHIELSRWLTNQDPWSDVPIILIMDGGTRPMAEVEAARLIGSRANVTIIDRPLRRTTLLSATKSALKARRRQYEVRNLLAERDQLLSTLEQRVSERTATLRQLNTELESFSYSVSHDLRSPLRALRSYAEILCHDFKEGLPEEARHYLDRIARSVERMDRLTQDVLSLSRLSKSDIVLDVHDLGPFLAELIDEYPALSAVKDKLELRSPLGEVVAHGPSLAQCFSNLLHNAVKFVPADRVPRIRVYSKTYADRRVVYVEDNGIGIDPRHHSRIFGIFERVGPVDVAGTGIGLAIAKKAVERMGGTIGVDSSPGDGARFWVDLQAAPAVPAAERVDGAPVALAALPRENEISQKS